MRVYTLRAVMLPAVLVFTLLSNLGQSLALLAFIALLYGPVLWITVLLHELGHCLATRKVRHILDGEHLSLVSQPFHGVKCSCAS